jgi:hypothetical protein
MELRELLPHVLLVFGIGFLIANVRVAWDLIRYLRRRRHALLVWPGSRPPLSNIVPVLAIALGCLLIANLLLRRAPSQLFGEGMMFLYFGCAVPLTRRIGRGFYADGIWAENGFMPYQQIGGIAWREGEQLTLLLISRLKQMARPLIVPTAHYGAVRRLLRDKMAAHDIQFSGGGLDLGQDERDHV